MNKLFSTIAISLSTLIVSTAFAAPYEHRDRHDMPAKPVPAHWNQKQYNDRYDRDYRDQSKKNTLGIGQTLPRKFDHSRFTVNGREAQRLPNTGRYEQWYKINGDYYLVNERNDRILRILR